MKHIKYLLYSLIVLSCTLSCSKKELNINANEQGATNAKETTFNAFITESDTKTSLIKDNDAFKVTWASGDDISIIRKSTSFGNRTRFSISTGAGTKNGTFTGNILWDPAYTYYAIHPHVDTRDYIGKPYINIYSINTSGQVQNGNDNYDHLAKYDLMLAVASNVQQDIAPTFMFKHLMALFNFELTLPSDAKGKVTKLSLISSNSTFSTRAAVVINDNNPSLSSYYSNSELSGIFSNSLDLSFANNGFDVPANKVIKAAMMSVPQMLYNSKLKVVLTVNDNGTEKEYFYKAPNNVGANVSEGYYVPKNYIGGKTYNFKANLSLPDANDGVVRVLQTHTLGSGIDIVIMGDGFNSADCQNGANYDKAINAAYNYLWDENFFKKFKEYFNVYSVKAVSKDNQFVAGYSTALGVYFGSGSFIGGDLSTCNEYAKKARSGINLNSTLVLVVVNSNKWAGTCHMSTSSDAPSKVYSSGNAVAFCPMIDLTNSNSEYNNREDFRNVIHHEAIGHGFAKLADEYFYEDITPSEDVKNKKRNLTTEYGWYANVDFTNVNTLWNSFIARAEYASEGLGAYEGAFVYGKGVWRPTQISTMVNNRSGFNAPCREAIYKRVMALSGINTSPTRDNFITYEINNGTIPTTALSTSLAKVAKEKILIPFAPPIVIEKTW